MTVVVLHTYRCTSINDLTLTDTSLPVHLQILCASDLSRRIFKLVSLICLKCLPRRENNYRQLLIRKREGCFRGL
jgi:hypothetical protein